MGAGLLKCCSWHAVTPKLFIFFNINVFIARNKSSVYQEPRFIETFLDIRLHIHPLIFENILKFF